MGILHRRQQLYMFVNGALLAIGSLRLPGATNVALLGQRVISEKTP